MEGHGPEAAMIAVQANLTPALFAGWKVWPLVNCITFGVIPVTQRILFVNSVALFWISFLSFVSNKPPDPTVQNQAVAMIAAADAGHCTSPTQ
jgi:protein Mpv17